MSDTADGQDYSLESLEKARSKELAATTCLSAMYSCWADCFSHLANSKSTHGDPLVICLEARSAALEACCALQDVGQFERAQYWQIIQSELETSNMPRRILRELLRHERALK